MGKLYHPSSLKADHIERSASMVQELIEHEYVSGYLKKWSPVIGRGWQSRYFALLEQDRTLVYWAKKPSFRDEQPRGSINLKIVENVFADGPLGITLSTPHRDYQLKASTPTEKDKWMDAIILWTLKSRKYRSKAEDSKNFRFSNMLIEATQSCLHYIVESFLKPFKKSATRAIEVGPETLSNSNKKKFLKDRGLYVVICKAWMVSRELKGDRAGSKRKGNLNYLRDGLETRAISTLSIDKEYQFNERLMQKEFENSHHHDSHQIQQLCEDTPFGNISQSHPRFGAASPTLSMEGSENSQDSEVFCSLTEIEDVSMGCETDEILIPFDSALCIYDHDCPPTIEEDEEYVRNKQHKYSLQLSELMLNQLSSLSKEAFLDNCVFGLVYIKRSNPIIPSLQSNDIFWALMISSRSLSDSHQIYPSPLLSEKTILGDCLDLYREVRMSSKNSTSSCSKYSCTQNQSQSQSNRDSIPVLEVIKKSHRSKCSMDGIIDMNDSDIKNKVKSIDHKTQIDNTLFSPIGNNFLSNLTLNIGSGGVHIGINNQAIDPYGFLLDTLYLYYPRNESKNPVHMLDPGLILSVGPISESIHGFSFTVSYLGASVIEDYIVSDLEFNVDFPSDIPSSIGTDYIQSTEKRPITLEICTRSWRDAKAWRYSLLVARKSKMADKSHKKTATKNYHDNVITCGMSKCMHADEAFARVSNYHCFDSCPTLTTTASSSARTSHGYHLANYRRNISNFALHR
ncbi:41 kd oocyst wall protein [Cryptosporidium ubiquitum]|uniref:41 kd oocyst wall protein n=1 Tax=Cryptosporidium ubiquitum TaxID=857276 RepID=A0A1J4MFC6_9CRYT|nr:41 kd oocyst wall protein [Cryptosporidium ubiquitum]OII72163.1 41 kd oocyst wall protein [Cryptosporidium ubiquitum]